MRKTTGDNYMQRMTVWIDPIQWEQFKKAVPRREMSEIIRGMIGKYLEKVDKRKK